MASMASTSSNMVTSPMNSISSIRATKRKFDDAISNLDSATRSTDTIERPSPFKKPKTSTRSLYSTLAKYGIKTKESKSGSVDSDLTKSTPHLAKILARTASRTRQALQFKPSTRTAPTSTLSSSTEYRPSSTPSFLTRLATFKLSTWANKPAAIDAVAAAKCGWINDGKDRLVCGLCEISWIAVGREGMNRDAANTLAEKQRVSMVEMHKDGCPWKTRQCDASIYRIPLQAPATMAKDIKSNASKLESVLLDVEVKHPLTTAQVASLRTTISSISLPARPISEDDPPSSPSDRARPSPVPTDHQPSDPALLTSLFGWSLAPPVPERERPSTPSLSRASSAPRTPLRSRASSTLPSAPSTPPISRAQSVARGEKESTPVRQMFKLGSLPPSAPQTPRTSRDTSLLHCVLCQRRIGLWAFAPPTPRPSHTAPRPGDAESAFAQLTTRPKRQFDLLKEHRSYCPYVVRSTVVPSMPSSASTPRPSISSPSLVSLNSANPTGALEGWRAVLSVVLRYGIGQRQRMHIRSQSEAEARRPGMDQSSAESLTTAGLNDDAMEVDGIDMMMQGVKRRGGKDLLKYVKGLLR
ncbi:zf-C3HC-domain-containing protein [Athelia psychrophila]|uniref:Zf-C3HC-domain-containing protein n=1 Tax=Athelia psychrophila TaxID=1759441 RepID=A0A166ULT4_9AGAM|nr:zf-C3HC-domain-containing protein [Fibularhizoctonia sp. CBS 109695]